jgi:hypothetical protein
MIFSNFFLPFLPLTISSYSLADTDTSCNDLAQYRTDLVSEYFDTVKAEGFFYENAFQDLAQVGSTCGYYSKNASEGVREWGSEGDVVEWFGFTYKNPRHMMLRYSMSEEKPELGVYTKKIDMGEDGFGPPISSVVVVSE